MITFQIPSMLRNRCAGAAEITIPAQDLRRALEELEQRHPGLYRSICDETGRVRRHVNLFVNTTHMRDCGGMDSALTPGDIVTILPAVSGG
jgi:molybdopterin converting factor small subunit